MAKQAVAAGEEADRIINEGFTDRDEEGGEFDDDLSGDGDRGDTFEQKYNVLQGKYNAELGRLNEMVSNLLEEKAQLEVKGGREQANVGSGDEYFGNEGEDEINALKEQYPSLFKGLTSLAKKIATESASKKTEDVEKTVNALIQKTERSEIKGYYEDLNDSVPDWEKINKDPKFVAWLQGKDRYTSASKHDLLKNAFASKNVEATKAFFEDFAEEQGIDIKKKRAREIAPEDEGGSIDTGTRGSSGGGYITRDEISKFYQDRTKGTYTGTEEDAIKQEARILKAVREKKVR